MTRTLTVCRGCLAVLLTCSADSRALSLYTEICRDNFPIVAQNHAEGIAKIASQLKDERDPE